MTDDGVIRFQATTFKVQTMQSGGWRLTLDGWDLGVFGKLAETQQPGVVLEIAAIPVVVKQEETVYDVQKGSKRKSEWTTAKIQSANSNT